MNSGAAIGATAPAEDTAPATAPEEDTAPVDDNADSERESGLRQNAQAMFDTYVESLSLAAAVCARLLFNTHANTWDREFKNIARK